MCAPAAGYVTVQAAPDPETGTDWQPGTGAPLSEKLTVPPAGAGAMVAVKVTGRLAAAGFADEVTVVLVGVAVGSDHAVAWGAPLAVSEKPATMVPLTALAKLLVPPLRVPRSRMAGEAAPRS